MFARLIYKKKLFNEHLKKRADVWRKTSARLF